MKYNSRIGLSALLIDFNNKEALVEKGILSSVLISFQMVYKSLLLKSETKILIKVDTKFIEKTGVMHHF